MTQPRQRDTEAIVFAWRQGVNVRSFRQALPSGVTRVIVHPTETAMLQAWLAWLQQADPDILNVFQVSTAPLPACMWAAVCTPRNLHHVQPMQTATKQAQLAWL